MTAIQNAARIVPIDDPTLVRFAIIRGLRPAIRLHVLQTGATTLDSVVRAARVAEAALTASGPTDDVGQLTTQVTQLLAKLTTKPIVAAMDSPADETRRRVAFADERRSPSPRPASLYRAPSPVNEDRQRPDQQRGAWSRPMERDRPFARPSTGPIGRWTPTPSKQPRPLTSPLRQDGGRQPYEQAYHAQPARGTWQRSSSARPSSIAGNACGNCGRRHPYGECGVINLVCYRCQRVGHLSRFCRSAPRPAINSSY